MTLHRIIGPARVYVGGQYLGEAKEWNVGNKHDDRRWKMLYVDPDEVLDIVQGWRNCQMLMVPQGQGIPEDCKIVDVRYDADRRDFAFRLWHPSFEPVPPGEITPTLKTASEQHFRAMELVQNADERTAVVKATGKSFEEWCNTPIAEIPGQVGSFGDAMTISAAKMADGVVTCIPRPKPLTFEMPELSASMQRANDVMQRHVEDMVRNQLERDEEKWWQALIHNEVLYKVDGTKRIALQFAPDKKRVLLSTDRYGIVVWVPTSDISPLPERREFRINEYGELTERISTPLENSPNGVKVEPVAKNKLVPDWIKPGVRVVCQDAVGEWIVDEVFPEVARARLTTLPDNKTKGWFFACCSDLRPVQEKWKMPETLYGHPVVIVDGVDAGPPVAFGTFGELDEAMQKIFDSDVKLPTSEPPVRRNPFEKYAALE